MTFIGVDPGKKGSLALLENGAVSIFPFDGQGSPPRLHLLSGTRRVYAWAGSHLYVSLWGKLRLYPRRSQGLQDSF